MMYLLLLVYIAIAAALQEFPDSDDPISGQPKLQRPSGKACTVDLFVNASMSTYSELQSAPFSLPENCKGPWARIILDFKASENGTQYDRFGAVWISGIEVLRTTTPEPTSDGIVWAIEKDLTIYGDYFQSISSALYAYIAIPNNIDSTYTGIPLVNLALTFYTPNDEYPSETSLPVVIPLTVAVDNVDGVFSAMQVVGNQSLTYNFTLDLSSTSSSSRNNVNGLIAEIYASAHGCEEFYYTNIPSENASTYGLCGGGVYREIQVFVDNTFAGAVLPFPVIYTGGINPFLWRPLTGIMSFDIVSHRLDLTPFLGGLIDGLEHEISFTVLNNNEAGLWYLDASLLLIKGEGQDVIVGGGIDSSRFVDSGAQVSETTSVETDGGAIRFKTIGSHSYSIFGNIIMQDGSSVIRSVSGNLNTINDNYIVSSTTMRTLQNSTNSITSSLILQDGTTYNIKQNSFYPLVTENYYNQNSTTFDMQAIVDYNYGRSQTWEVIKEGKTDSFDLLWYNKILSNATYNRTLDHTTVYIEFDRSHEEFRIDSKVNNGNVDNCYLRRLYAKDGSVVADSLKGEGCKLPKQISFCGFVVCGLYGIYPAQMVDLSSTDKNGADNYNLYYNNDTKQLNFDHSNLEPSTNAILKRIKEISSAIRVESIVRSPKSVAADIYSRERKH